MAITKIPAAGFTGNNFRNIIINGDMSIAQRGTSKTGFGNGDNGYYTCDRWFSGEAGTPTCEFTLTQDTDVPTGQGFAKSFKWDCTTAEDPISAGTLIYMSQGIEGQNLQYLKKGTANAESLTLSFWVKSNKTGTYTLRLQDQDNTRIVSFAYTINSASTWEKKIIIIPADTTGTLDNDNNASLYLFFHLAAGTNWTSGTIQNTWGSLTNANLAVGQVNLADNTANEFYITGVQLEAGTTASDFEFLPHDVNLQRCLRYLPSIQVKTYTPGGICLASDDARAHLKLPVKARTAPTGISYDGTIQFMRSTGTLTGTGIAFYTATEDVINIIDVGASSLSAGNSTGLGTDASNTRTILCTGCEL